MEEQAILYTDGACSGNPGPGGWGWALVISTEEGEVLALRGLSGESDTTNNRMELKAAIMGLMAMDETMISDLTIATDSNYVLKGMTEWIEGWKKKNWIGTNKQPVKNQDLWVQLDAECSRFPELKWLKIKGHSGHKWNDYVDALAVEAVKLLKE